MVRNVVVSLLMACLLFAYIIAGSLVCAFCKMNVYFRFKKVEEAEKLFVEMKGRDIVPNVISFTTMLKGYVAAGQIDDALKVFEEMKGCGVKPQHTPSTWW